MKYYYRRKVDIRNENEITLLLMPDEYIFKANRNTIEALKLNKLKIYFDAQLTASSSNSDA